MLLNELDVPLDDVVVVDRLHIADYNEANILPQDNDTLERLLKWLSPTKYAGDGSELKKHAASHLEGTSQWLIDSSVFEQWHHGNSHGILWIRGVPGTGKSVLAARLITHLSSEECPVLYFFSRYTIQSNHRPEAALRDWIAQILPFSPPLQLALKNLTSGDISIGSVDDLSMVELWNLLRLALKCIPKAYCVVDALDEMDREFMEQFLQVLDQLGNIHPDRVKLVITSRPIATIEKIIRNLRVLDIRLGKDKVEPDILKYLHHRLDQLSIPSECRDTIIPNLLKTADGLFLYAKFTMDAISKLETMTAETITKALDGIPVDLSAMYTNLLQEHMGRTELPEGLCVLVLQLVTHATRPLRLLEIADCIKVTRPQMGKDTAILKDLVRTSCGPLLEILPDETVRVVHHSLTEYLFGVGRTSSDKHIPLFEPGPMHNHLALICLSYLRQGCLDNLNASDTQHGYVIGVSGKEHQLPPFLMYAVDNWHVHIKKSSSQAFVQDEANRQITSLLMTPKYPRKLVMLYNRINRSDEPYLRGLSRGHDISREVEVLLLAIYLDLTLFVEYFLYQNDGDAARYPGVKFIESPLHLAVRGGNLEVVRMLISKGADTSHCNSQGNTPLHLALGSSYRYQKIRRYPDIVGYLLEAGADPWKDQERNREVDDMMFGANDPYPPIRKAMTMGDGVIVKLFLPYIKSKEVAERALDWIMENSHKTEVMHLILNLGLVDINGFTNGKTPLLRACEQFDPKAISILLEAGADPNVLHDDSDSWVRRRNSSATEEGRNVLHTLAASHRPYRSAKIEMSDQIIKECFQLVLNAGANVNQADHRKMTPLHLAKDPLVAKILLDAGADPLAMNQKGSTPLHVAYSVDVIEVLLTRTDINTRNDEGKTVLLQTFSGDRHFDATDRKPMHEKALKLLDMGSDPNITDNNGDSILHYLATKGGMSKPDGRLLLERLIQNGADVNLRNNKGQTAIHKLQFGHPPSKTEIADLETLLELTDIDINAVDNEGNTFLFSTIGDGRFPAGDLKDEYMNTMVKVGARFDITDGEGRTLLHAAIRQYHGEELLKLLVEHGVDPEQTDNEGNTIWHAAASRLPTLMNSKNLLDNIKALGVDVRKPNNRGRLPLHIMCEHYQYFLEQKAHYGFRGRPVLFDYMLEQGYEDIYKADNDGVSPLHLASTFSTYLTRVILDAGADATLATHEELNVFHLAARWRQSNTIGLLLEWFRMRASEEKLFEAVNAKDKRGRDPLYYACASGHYPSVELFVKAGAVIDTETYEGSALQGYVKFEEASKNWTDGACSAFSAVHFNDTARLKRRRYGRLQSSYKNHGNDQINEILALLIGSTTSATWNNIDLAIAEASNRQHDYTVESLLQVRKSLGIEGPLPSTDAVQACLERRSSVLASVERGRQAGNTLSKQIWFMFELRLYHTIPSYIKEYPHEPEIKELHGFCLELARRGCAGLLDALLTPDLVSALQNPCYTAQDSTLKTSDEDMVSLLLAACQSEEPNLPVIKVLVKKGAKLDEYSTTGKMTPLHAIVKHVDNQWWQTAQALPYMLDQTLNWEVRDENGLTPLNASLQGKDQPSWRIQATEMLLRAGADPSSLDNEGTSCLARAAGHESLFKLLLRHGAEVHPAAMAAAVLAKDVNMLEMMLASGAHPNVRKVGQNTDYSKSSEGRCRRVKVDDPNDESELYVLDLLITSMGYEDHNPVCEDMIKLLFEHGADPNSRYRDTTVAHRILQKRRSRVHSASAQRNCYADTIVHHPRLDVNLEDENGVTILHAACKVGDLISTKALLERGSDIYRQDKQGRNILHFGLRHGLQSEQGFLEYLITLGPDLLHQVDTRGQTPLHCEMQQRVSEKVIELFVSKGACVSATDTDGNTPLHLIFKQHWFHTVGDNNVVWDEPKKRVVDLFLSQGADINARNKAGETPLFTYFRECCIRAVLPWDETKRKAIKGSRTWKECEKDLDRIATEQEPSLWALLDEFGVDWTVVNNDRESLLHVVAAEWRGTHNRRQRRFQFLTEKGLNALAENAVQQTALDVAAARGAADILALFNVD